MASLSSAPKPDETPSALVVTRIRKIDHGNRIAIHNQSGVTPLQGQ